MASGSSKELIGQLRETGWNFSKIGKALGRDSSLISQISAGKKPGRNLEASLRELLTGKKAEEIAKPERRKNKSGQTAKVRESAKAKAEREERERKEREKAEAAARKEAERKQKAEESAQRRLERFDPGTRVVMYITTKSGRTITLGSNGGINVELISGMGIFAFAAAQGSKQNYGLDEESILRVEFEDFEDF